MLQNKWQRDDMLHLFDLTESHTQSLRIPSWTSSSTSMCVFLCFAYEDQMVSQWEKRWIISVRTFWWAIVFRVPTSGLVEVEHGAEKHTFCTIVSDQYVVAQILLPCWWHFWYQLFISWPVICLACNLSTPDPIFNGTKMQHKKANMQTSDISARLFSRPAYKWWEQALRQQWNSKDRNFPTSPTPCESAGTKIWWWSRSFHCQPQLPTSICL